MLLHLNQLPNLGGWGIRFLINSRQKPFQESYLHNARLARFSQEVMAELRARTSLEFEYSDRGILKIFENPASLESALKTAHWLRQVEIDHRLLETDALLALEPALVPVRQRLVGAIHYPGDEVGDARLFCEGLVGLLRDAGVEFRFGEQALAFEAKGDSIRSLATPRGPLDADAFVIAAGSFSRGLSRKLKLRLPVIPAKGYSITVPIENRLPRLAVVDDELHAAIVPLGDNRLRVAGTAEFAGFDDQIRPDRIRNLRNLLARVYPEVVVEEDRLEAWAGLRPMTPDGRPILGGSRVRNLFFNTGHGALGWTLACGSGKVVAELVTGNRPSYGIEPFQLGRFG